MCCTAQLQGLDSLTKMFYANGLPKSGSEVNQVTPYIINAFDISNVQLLNFKQ